ncbi:MAG: rod shape-determining protein MreD [Candidatus Aminicenantales bacterium]
MKDFIEIVAGILLAFVLYWVLRTISVSFVQLFNILGLVVIYFGLKKGETFGAFLGAGLGLLQDSFTLGVFGVAGLSKTLVGFIAGYVPKRINVAPVFRNTLFIFVLLCLDLIFWALLSSFIYSEKIFIGNPIYSFQPLATTILGSLFFLFLRRLKYFPR